MRAEVSEARGIAQIVDERVGRRGGVVISEGDRTLKVVRPGLGAGTGAPLAFRHAGSGRTAEREIRSAARRENEGAASHPGRRPAQRVLPDLAKGVLSFPR